MVIQRRTPRHSRHGPSCLFVLLVALTSFLGGFVIANGDQLRNQFIATPTLEPTRDALAYLSSAGSLVQDGAYEEAIAAYEAAIALDPTNATYFLPLIELLLRAHQPGTAVHWAKKAANLAPNDDEVWTALAGAHLESGLYLDKTNQSKEAGLAFQQAIEAGRIAVQLNPENAIAHAYMAGSMAQSGQHLSFPKAQALAEHALELEPTNPIVRRQLGIVFKVQGYYFDAMEQYQKALEFDSESAALYVELAYLYFFNDFRQQAILTMREALVKDPANVDAYDGLSYFYFLIGEYSQAEEFGLQAVRLEPQMVRAHAHLGAAYFKQQKYSPAIEELQMAVAGYQSASMENATYFNMLGLAYYHSDPAQCADAIPLFNQVLEVAVTNSPAEANALEGLALCHAAAPEATIRKQRVGHV